MGLYGKPGYNTNNRSGLPLSLSLNVNLTSLDARLVR